MGKDAQSAFDVLNEIENENMDSHQVELEEPQNIDNINPFMSYTDLLNIGNTSESGSSTKKRKRRKTRIPKLERKSVCVSSIRFPFFYLPLKIEP